MTDILLEAGEEDIQLDEHHDEKKTTSKNKESKNNSNKNEAEDSGRVAKGRGFDQSTSQQKETAERYSGKGGQFEALTTGDNTSGPQRSVEGWIIFVRNVHEEATDDMILDKFSEFGEVKNIQMPLDRKTGYMKGYALLEYSTLEEAEAAVKEMDKQEFMDTTITVDFAFCKPDNSKNSSHERKRRGKFSYNSSRHH